MLLQSPLVVAGAGCCWRWWWVERGACWRLQRKRTAEEEGAISCCAPSASERRVCVQTASNLIDSQTGAVTYSACGLRGPFGTLPRSGLEDSGGGRGLALPHALPKAAPGCLHGKDSCGE